MTSSPPAKRFDWRNLALRALSAAILAPLALLCVWLGGLPFLVMLSVATAVLTIEWGEMCDKETPIRAAAVIAAAVLVGVFATYLKHPWIGWTLVAVGAAVGALIALARGRIDRPADIAFGVLYMGAPCVALMWLRGDAEGRGWTLMLIAAVWAADIGAFAVGSLLKGPKLWPRFSPNKTWSGFFGGLLASVLAAEAILLLLPHEAGPGPRATALVGLAVGLAAMGGDLWESMLKRRFGVKDSGSLIPGHGGLLDRVDGLMFGALVMAFARWIWSLGAGF
jgi:phosphatidate cytidylyltransferase